MNSYSPETKQWALTSIICGFITVAAFLSSTQLQMSMQISYIIFMFYGAFMCITMFSVYNFLKVYYDSVFLKLSTLTLIIAGAVHTVGASMQGALRIYMRDITHDSTVPETTQAAWKMAMHAGNSLQLGVDMAFDIFLLGGFILFGIAMINHPQFGKKFGWPAIIIGIGGLTLNAWTFPIPPGNDGLFDGGPLVGIWFFIFTIQLYRIYKQNKTPDIVSS